MKKSLLFIALLIFCTTAFQNCKKHTEEPAHDTSHWDYEHTDWSSVNTDCNGVIQSPIDIITANTVKSNLPDISFTYGYFPISIVDNGHTIQVNTYTYGATNTIKFNNVTYKLKQFHFHASSEHMIDGSAAPMEMHFVHQSESGALMVVGVMINEGAKNDQIQKILDEIPPTKETEISTASLVNVENLLPANRDYYNYVGSLTTPPCSMGLEWMVLKTSITISKDQISAFKARYSHNSRPVQPLNNRIVYEKI